MKAYHWLHPLLFVLSPVAFLYSQNAGVLAIVEIVRPALVLVLSVGVTLIALKLFVRDTTRATIVLSFLIISFFAYGHIHSLIPDFRWYIGPYVLYPNTVLLPIWCLLVATGFVVIIRLRRDLSGASNVLAFSATALIGISVLSGAVAAFNTTGNTLDLRDLDVSVGENRADLPDIYYIILDGYAGNDLLADRFGYDNSAFTNALRARGFNVIEESRSNYSQTIVSVSSSLNMSYHTNTVATLGEDSEDRKSLIEMIKTNRVNLNLRGAGYHLVTLASGYYGTEITRVDEYISPKGALSELEEVLLATTPVPVLMNKLNSVKLHATRIQHNLDKLASMTASPSPKFLFAHLLCPHPPFVFDATGANLGTEKLQIFAHGKNGVWPSGELNEQRYVDQIRFINTRILAAIDSILVRSQPLPVIILQADHGPLFPISTPESEDEFYRNKFSILNALYLPGVDTATIPVRISPVNNFRLVLNSYLGADLPLYDDLSYYSTWEKPLKLTLIPRE